MFSSFISFRVFLFPFLLLILASVVTGEEDYESDISFGYPQDISTLPPAQLNDANESLFAMSPQREPVMVCYYGSWAVYRPGRGKFQVEDIPPELCTHLIYTFAGLRADNLTIVSLDPYNDLYDNYGKGAYLRFTRLKKSNPALKTLLAIGGWNEGSTKYSHMVETANRRATFITSCVQFLKKYGFDGLDLDWEYPTLRGGRPQDKANFAALLSEMRETFSKHKLLMTSAVSAGKVTIDAAYDVGALARNLDLVHLMAYDLHGSWEQYAHHHSPLYAHPRDKGANALLNVDYAVRYWLGIGLPREKLVLGIGLYGRCFTLARADDHDIYSPSYQAGRPGPYTREPGMMGYNEICEDQGREKWTTVRDAHLVGPYSFHDRQWCGYDDVDSVTVKAKYINTLGLAGAMVWSIETDDFHGICHDDTFPLINTIRSIIDDNPGPTPTPIPTPTPTPDPDTTTTDTPTTTTTTPPPPPPPTPSPTAICHREGFNADPEGDCTIFYCCHQVGDHWEVYLFHCAPGTIFVEDLQICDFPDGHPECSLLPTSPSDCDYPECDSDGSYSEDELRVTASPSSTQSTPVQLNIIDKDNFSELEDNAISLIKAVSSTLTNDDTDRVIESNFDADNNFGSDNDIGAIDNFDNDDDDDDEDDYNREYFNKKKKYSTYLQQIYELKKFSKVLSEMKKAT